MDKKYCLFIAIVLGIHIWFANTLWHKIKYAKNVGLDLVIFNINSKIPPDDPRLLEYVRSNHLFPPLPVEYKLSPKYLRDEGHHIEVLKLLKNKTNGVFVESGANDGQFLSTTLELEKNWGWTGLLVEPDGQNFEKLRTKGRRSWLCNTCLSVKPVPMKVSFVHNNKMEGLHKLTNVPGVASMEDLWPVNQKEMTTVKCFPFYTLALALNMTVIDYLSLDIEGAELEVLKTIPFDKILIRTMTIEYSHVRKMPSGDKKLKNLLAKNGFILVKTLTGSHTRDYLYAHKSALKSTV